MVKSELIKKIADKVSVLNDKDVELAVKRIITCISKALAAGERVEIRGFGSFTLRYHAPRKAHNPKTGEKLITTPTHTVHFKPGKELKERLN